MRSTTSALEHEAPGGSGSLTHDAFISYSRQDRDWVDGVLRPALDRAGVTYLIDRRDFEHGFALLDQIEQAVERARRYVLVISPSYLQKDYTGLEYKMIRELDPQGSKGLILPLVVERCAVPLSLRILTLIDMTADERIDETMQAVLRRLTDRSGELAEEARCTARMIGDPQSARRASEGVDALGGLLGCPTVRDAAAGYAKAFGQANELITMLGADKGLHERFHRLKDLCDTIRDPMRRARTDPSAWEEIGRLRAKVMQGVEDVVDFASGRPGAAGDEIWRRVFEQCGAQFQQAARDRDAAGLAAAFEGLIRVMGSQLGQLDARLVTTARALNRSPLVDALRGVDQALDDVSMDEGSGARARKFREGVEALGRLFDQLQECVNNHSVLQELVDAALMVAGPLEQGDAASARASLAPIWPHLAAALGRLEGARPWAARLRADGDAVGRALESADPAALRGPFDDFLARLGGSFGLADRDLLDLCENLQDFGKSMAAMLELVSDA